MTIGKEPASPVIIYHNEIRDNDALNQQPKGLTKREYFAAMALQGLLARQSKGSVFEFADVAVCQADALIAELNKSY